METILIVEDEADLLSTLELNLSREGYKTQSANLAQRALAIARSDPPPDLIILDLMLPDLPGTEVCRQLRADPRTKRTPVLMLTARGEEIDRVVGFEVGADDYVVKPFSVRELILRIQALLRRARAGDDGAADVRFGRLRVDAGGHRVWADDQELRLTALEFRLLMTLMGRRGRVQTREVLLSDVWGLEGDLTTRTVDTHVKRLREKLGVAGDYIETLRGVGYRFRPSPDEIAE